MTPAMVSLQGLGPFAPTVPTCMDQLADGVVAEGGLGGVAAAGREGVPIRGHRGVGGGGGLVFVIAEVVDAAPAAGDRAGEGGVLQREAAGRGESPGLRRRSQPHFLTKEGLPLPMGRASPTRGKQFPPRKRSADL